MCFARNEKKGQVSKNKLLVYLPSVKGALAIYINITQATKFTFSYKGFDMYYFTQEQEHVMKLQGREINSSSIDLRTRWGFVSHYSLGHNQQLPRLLHQTLGSSYSFTSLPPTRHFIL